MTEPGFDAAPATALTATAEPGAPNAAVPRRWSFAQRVAFRFAFSYLTLFALCCGNATIWRAIPFFGRKIEALLNLPFLLFGQYLAVHLFHLGGPGATLHSTGYSDRLLDWFAAAIMLVLAIAATLAWSLLDRRRTEYSTLFAWFRFGLRLTLAVAMINYGSWKIFPIQMPPPSLAVLNEKLGNTAPMTLLWTLLGLTKGYERLTGIVEIAAGLLLLYRRTALLGALLAILALGNILAFNLFFDVPVKLYASCLLLMALIVILPDLRAMSDFFWRHRPALLRDAAIPPRPSRRGFIAIAVLEIALFLNVGLHASFEHYRQYATEQANLRHPSPLAGIWHIDSGPLDASGHSVPILTGYGAPLTDIVLEPNGRLNLRAADGTLWGGSTYRTGSRVMNFGGVGVPSHAYHIGQPDPDHLVLTPVGGNDASVGVLHLTRTPLPAHYPLLERGFHMANEWGVQR